MAVPFFGSVQEGLERAVAENAVLKRQAQLDEEHTEQLYETIQVLSG